MNTPLDRTALILCTVWPEETSSAAGVRVAQVIRCLRGAGWRIVLGSSARDNAFKTLWMQRGVETVQVFPNDPAFDSWIAALSPALVIFDRFILEEQWGWRVADHAPKALRIVDTEDLHSLRRAREAIVQDGGGLTEVLSMSSTFRTEDLARELGSLYRADWAWVISRFELDFLVSDLGMPPEKVSCVPFLYSSEEILGSPPGHAQRDRFCVIGNFRHPPNVDGVRWLLGEIWPTVRKLLPNAELDLYGAYPSAEHMRWSNPSQGVRVLGPTPSAPEMLKKYRVNLAPLRYGAGIKGKVADGWRVGTPCVTTPIGSEGMLAPSAQWGGSIAVDPASFAAEAVRLHEDAEAWAHASQLGIEAMHLSQSLEREGPYLLQQLEDRIQKREDLRKKNVLGFILKSDLVARTRYFSRWIELKESKKTSG